MTDLEARLAKRIVGWVIAVGLTLAFGAGLFAKDVTGRIANLEETRITKEDAAKLQSSIDLLRQSVQFLRDDIQQGKKGSGYK